MLERGSPILPGLIFSTLQKEGWAFDRQTSRSSAMMQDNEMAAFGKFVLQ